ncbi:MAG: hypothetical protein ACFE85_14730 [Candidatus Hodarchaeota archaeon]
MSKVKEDKTIVFNYNDEINNFEELEIDDEIPLYELLEPDLILLFIDKKRSKVWHWIGSETTTKMKFIAAILVENVRDSIGISLRIVPVDEGSEPEDFKILLGLEEKPKMNKINNGPNYRGTYEDEQRLDSLKLKDILLKLSKVKIPKDYERKFVVVDNKIYAYKEFKLNYYGTIVSEKKLFPLEGYIPDDYYLLWNCVLRLHFSFDKLNLIEILQKM